MKPIYNAVEYIDPEKVYTYSRQINNDINLEVYIQINSEKFTEYQKEIFEDFVADFVDQVKDEALTPDEVEKKMEEQLAALNKKLQDFANKLRDVPKCELKGYTQLIMWNEVKTWMIWKISLAIFRDDKLFSVLENSYKEQANIDQFSDFIGGEIERGDILLYMWWKLSEVLDQHDCNDLEGVLEKENADAMLDFLDDVFWSRIDKKEVGFASVFSITGLDIVTPRWKGKISSFAKRYTSKLTNTISSKIDLMKWKKQSRKVFDGNKYYVMVGFLILAILFLSAAIFSQFRRTQSNKIYYQTSTWAMEEITIESLQKDIMSFKMLESSSDEKSEKYNEILQKISTVKYEWKWLETVAQLEKMLEQERDDGFMIRTISSLSQFDDERTWRKTVVLTFNSSETSAMWNPVSISVDASSIFVWGQQAALIGVVNDSTRGNLVEYNLWHDAKNCSLSLSKKWIFCYSTDGELFFVNKLGVEPMEVVDGDRSTRNIGWIWIYGRSNLYLFQSNPNNIASALLTRYRNVAWSENKYQGASNYSIIAGSWVTLPQELVGFSIDGNFLAWWDGKLYQFWRSSNIGTTLDMRVVEMNGWDKTSSQSYSNNVKIISADNSPYIYLFDKDKQTFTVYESSPVKTNENYKTAFRLYYMFRFKFDLGSNKIIDVAVPDTSADRPELYLLSMEGVNKINLYDFIDSLKSNKNLKTLNDAE